MSSSSLEMRRWFHGVLANFKEELKNDVECDRCVFLVPKSLSSAKPEAYTPQLVGLGPYHHLQPQLTKMERVKLDIVKKLHQDNEGSSFTELVKNLSKLDPYVRACYLKFLDIDKEMLPWIMAVDAQFLINLLWQRSTKSKSIDKKTPESSQSIDKKTSKSPESSQSIDKTTPEKIPESSQSMDKTNSKSSSLLQGLADPAGKKLAEDAILRDVMMLENQIPLFFLEKMWKLGCPPLEVDERNPIEEIFSRMLEGFCKALSPLKEAFQYTDAKKALKRAHLLDLLHSMVVWREDEFRINIPADLVKMEEEHKVRSHLRRLRAPRKKEVLQFAASSNLPVMEKMKPFAKILQELAPYFGPSESEEAPAEEKALIPTASSLDKAGVKFSTTKHIENIKFDKETHNFDLPAIRLGVNSEVVIRNSVAYEAMAISGPLLFTRFVELMDALINDPNDVKVLKKYHIIDSNLKDDEVARLFNGMSNSIEVHGHPQLDKTIKEVNDFYNAAPAIKAQKMRDRAWNVLVTVAAVIFLLLMALQSFCSAFGCSTLAKMTN